MAEETKRERKPVDKCPVCRRAVAYKQKPGADPGVEIPFNYRKSSIHHCKISAAEKRAGLITRFWRSRYTFQEIWYAQE